MKSLLLTVMIFAAFTAQAAMTAEGDAESRKPMPAMEGETIRIDVSEKGEVYIDGQISTLSGLKEFFEERVQNPEDKIIVTADEETLQEDVVAVMDVCCTYKYCKIKLYYKPTWTEKS